MGTGGDGARDVGLWTKTVDPLCSLKLECEKLVSEKTEMQRHYVMVSYPCPVPCLPQSIPDCHPPVGLWGSTQPLTPMTSGLPGGGMLARVVGWWGWGVCELGRS